MMQETLKLSDAGQDQDGGFRISVISEYDPASERRPVYDIVRGV